MFVGVVYGKVARYIVFYILNHQVQTMSLVLGHAVPEALSDAPFYERHHGRPVDPSDRIDSKMYRIEFEDIVALHLQCSF